MLATILRSLIDLPNLIVAPLVVLAATTALDKDRVRQTTRVVFGASTSRSQIRRIFRRVKLRLLLQVGVNRVLILTQSS